jgi:hypothetical protein
LCLESDAKTYYTDVFNSGNLLLNSSFQKKINAVTSNGYNVFNGNSNFYNDICTPFTNEFGLDVLLEDRKEYFIQNINICKDGCNFEDYNGTLNIFTCSCPTGKFNADGSAKTELVSQKLTYNFEKNHTYSNIKVFKCASQVFSKEGQKRNIGSYILLLCLASFIGVIVFYVLKDSKTFNKAFNDIEVPKPNPPKDGEEKEANSAQDSKSKTKKVEEKNIDDTKDDYGMNNSDYNYAKEKDKRSFLEMYWSNLKIKQLFIFTFYTSTDRNLRSVKIGLFILFISFYLAFTALFFNDSIMRQIYKYKGNTDAAVHVPNIILSSLCCLIMNFLVKFVSLSDRDMYNAQKDAANKDKIKKKIIIKTYILFGVSILLIGLFWYYVSAFCAVFKNSQGHYLINVFIAFIVCNIWPCITSLIPAALRKFSLNKDSPCIYKASQIVYYI